MTLSRRPDQATLDMFAQDLNEIREQTMKKVGPKDANYIRKVIRVQRLSEVAGRVTMVLGFINPALWVVGVLLLTLAKILDNMEIGHNVKHGQYDWMNDPNINSRNFEWDHAGDPRGPEQAPGAVFPGYQGRHASARDLRGTGGRARYQSSHHQRHHAQREVEKASRTRCRAHRRETRARGILRR